MTMHDPRKIAKVAKWLGPVCARMHVHHHVRVGVDHCEEGNHATIQRDGMGFLMLLEQDFFALSADMQRTVLVHELAHTYFDEMDASHEAMLSTRLSQVDASALRQLRLNAEHGVIEKVTRALAPLMPMPRF